MIPKVNFKWSWIYEQAYHSQAVKSEEFDYEIYSNKINDFISKIKKQWDPIEKEVFKLLSEETDLKWKEEKIPCYVIKRSLFFPISDPLTIPIELEGKQIFSLDPSRFVDMLTHELIHNLFIQNETETEKYFQEVFKIYPKEDFDTTIHLIVHAIHKRIILKIFDEKRLKKEIENNKFYPAYKRSWEIVLKEGDEKIVKEFKRFK